MDDLARQLVEAGAFRWEEGMAAIWTPGPVRTQVPRRDYHARVVGVESRPVLCFPRALGTNHRIREDDIWVWRDWSPGPMRAHPTDVLVPDLTDPATAALLAVQAMERGHAIAYTPMGGRWDWRVDRKWGTCDTPGEAAARALLAIHNGGTP